MVDQREHRNLAFYLQGYHFHGREIGARLANLQHYGHIGNLYTCSPGECEECEKYTVNLQEYEEDLQRRAIQRAREAIQIHTYASRRYNNASKNLIDFENEEAIDTSTITKSIGRLIINQQTPIKELNDENTKENETSTISTKEEHSE